MPEGYHRRFIESVNKLSARRAKVFPDIVDYFETILTFNDSRHWGVSFTNWNGAVNELIDNKKISLRVINKLFSSTQSLLRDGIVFSTASIKWNTDLRVFRFEYNETTPLSVKFTKMQLSCVALNNDSITIYDTEGTLNFITNEWSGKQGRITWEAAGYPSNEVYATFGEYKVDMSQPELNIDSVTFYNRNFF